MPYDTATTRCAMSLPVVYLPEAQDDVDAAYAAYEQRLAGLGNRFLAALF